MRREHRPYYLKRAVQRAHAAYARHFTEAHFDAVGEGCTFEGPWSLGVFGSPVRLGKHVQITSTIERPVKLGVWPAQPGLGSIDIGDYAMINPGCRINSSHRVEIGDNALLASGVLISDCDWHDAYDRVYASGAHAPVVLRPNVWVGEGAMICKGVTIGHNSIVGAGAVVTRDVEANTVVAGNPARTIRELDPEARFVSRQHVFDFPETFFEQARRDERALLADNTLADYLRYLIRPRRGD